MSNSNILDALYCIPPDIDREAWVKIAQALKSAGESLGTFEAWSSTSGNYKPSDCISVWKSITSDGGIGIGTLFHYAKSYGFKPSGDVDWDAVELGKKVAKERQAIEAKDKAFKQQEAALRATNMLDACTTATSHPYLVKKRIKPHLNVWVDSANRIIIPVMDIKGDVHSLQSIAHDGFKKFLPNGKVRGNFYQLWSGCQPSPSIVICEGYATGVTLYSHYAQESTVVIAFNAGNLLPAAKVFRDAFPDAQIIIAGDFDESGAGQRLAELAAVAVGGSASIPIFQDGEEGSDFNDRYNLDNEASE